jgi:hypothetical protein
LHELSALSAQFQGCDDPEAGQRDPSGHFAWILDPDGTKIEFWQPLKR